MRALSRAEPIGVVLSGATVPGSPQAASLEGGSGARPALPPQRLRRPSSPALTRIPREATSSAAAVLRSAAALKGCRSAVPSPEDRHRGRIGRLRGTVRRHDNGSDRHLHPRRRRQASPARSAPSTSTPRRPSSPSPRTASAAPDYRVAANGVEFGAGWRKAAKDTGAEYVSVKLDDPSFQAPVYATLVQGEKGEHKLIWSR